MDTIDLITLILAVWGAILSTWLGAKEIAKYRRQINIFLDHITFREVCAISITNIGHRPITIKGINLILESFGPVPSGALWEYYGQERPLPIVLSDGEEITINLSERLSQDVLKTLSNREKVFIKVTDSEGKKYTKFKTREIDAKWGEVSIKK